jgi:N,N'-diacetyllegionaminate synthase
MMSSNDFNIAGRAIGQDHNPFVIAEIGVNHDGSVDRAIELVDAAKQAGADAVKLQIFRADRLMHETTAFAEYQKQQSGDACAIAMLKRYELSREAITQIVAHIGAQGMIPLATPFSPDDVDSIESLGLPAVKIASPDIVNRPLIKRAVRLGRPLLVSTGAATFDEIRAFVYWLKPYRARFALLHCISSYPTPIDQAHLSWIGELRDAFKITVGYSDHTTELLSGAFAVCAGAVIVEKHLTHDRNAPGPDHAASADPEQFAQYVQLVRAAFEARGKSGKRVLDIEQDVRTVSRQSLVLRRDVPAGESLNESDLTVQRPGTGIPAELVHQVIGKKLTAPAKAGELLRWDKLADAA